MPTGRICERGFHSAILSERRDERNDLKVECRVSVSGKIMVCFARAKFARQLTCNFAIANFAGVRVAQELVKRLQFANCLQGPHGVARVCVIRLCLCSRLVPRGTYLSKFAFAS